MSFEHALIILAATAFYIDFMPFFDYQEKKQKLNSLVHGI